jgi:UDP:flavonoid glycosyltransferase YjiC (YdhE family)
MKVTIIAGGSRGDVEPYLALGQGLARAGYRVNVVTHENFDELVAARGLDLVPVAGDTGEVAAAMADQIEGGSFVSVMRKMAGAAEQAAVAMSQGALGGSEGAGMVLAGLGGLFTAAAVAEKRGIPFIQAYYIPFTPTAAAPSFLAAGKPLPSAGPVNRLTYTLARQAIWQGMRGADARARREVFGLAPSPRSGPWGSLRRRGEPVLYGYSPAVIPPPPDWGPENHVTGYWFPEPDPAWRPPPGLAAFLESGPPPVFVGFGSMPGRDREGAAAKVLEALSLAGQRGVILESSAMGGRGLPDSVYAIDRAPYEWLFPRMAAVVHHGGAGTTGSGLRAGVPSIVVPFFADQPFWGMRVHALGAGPEPLPRKQLTAVALAGRIRQAVEDREMRRRAASLGEAIRREDGVGNAVALIREYLHGLGERNAGAWASAG